MRLSQQLHIKPIYRITGTPENFLTALRFKIWGFNEQNHNKWIQLEPGDIIFFHSKGSGSFFNFQQRSSIIGFGVVGNKFFEDATPLWIDEIQRGYTYPYRFLFSEIYLFYDVPVNDDWDSTSLKKKAVTEQILQNLVNAGIPLSELNGFPHMGSYSSIKNQQVKAQLVSSKNPLAFYDGYRDENIDTLDKKTELRVVTGKNEVTRNTTTLTIFDDIRQKVIVQGSTTKRNNVEALNKAEKSHFEVLSHLFTFLQERGYKILKNTHIDLFAYKKDGQSLLIEAKSIENNNFISQSRKGIIQLFEYNHFDIQAYKVAQNLIFTNEAKILVTSRKPTPIQKDYVTFINSMGIKTAAVHNNNIINYGDSLNFKKL